MALIETISSSDLFHMACCMGRGEQFGHKGWGAIGDYLENLSDDLGEDIEIDIVGICCEYSMAESVQEFWEAQEIPTVSDEEWEDMGEEEKIEAIRDYLQENTSLVVCDEDCIIWQAF